jgi:hypothetical protein
MVLDRRPTTLRSFPSVRSRNTAFGCVEWRGTIAIIDADRESRMFEPPPGNTDASATMKGRSHQPGPYHLRLGVSVGFLHLAFSA